MLALRSGVGNGTTGNRRAAAPGRNRSARRFNRWICARVAPRVLKETSHLVAALWREFASFCDSNLSHPSTSLSDPIGHHVGVQSVGMESTRREETRLDSFGSIRISGRKPERAEPGNGCQHLRVAALDLRGASHELELRCSQTYKPQTPRRALLVAAALAAARISRPSCSSIKLPSLRRRCTVSRGIPTPVSRLMIRALLERPYERACIRTGCRNKQQQVTSGRQRSVAAVLIARWRAARTYAAPGRRNNIIRVRVSYYHIRQNLRALLVRPLSWPAPAALRVAARKAHPSSRAS